MPIRPGARSDRPDERSDARAVAQRLADAEVGAEADAGWFWLDGAEAPKGEERISYLGRASKIVVAERGREREFLEKLRADESRSSAPDGRRPLRTPMSGSLALGQRFASGWIVALGYEFGVGMLGLLDRHNDGEPGLPAAAEAAPAFALRIDEVIAIRHHKEPQEEAAAGAPPATLQDEGSQSSSLVMEHTWRSDDDTYLSNVDACREAIYEGEAYVLCLTDTAEVLMDELVDPLDLYTSLARVTPGGSAMRGGVISIQGRALVSASPERFISVSGRTVKTHPIKGTRRRGATSAEDELLASELAHDPKERAENLMIVDLMRNDLSRVCTPQSVCVSRFLDVERHPHVHQLVSTVSGELAPGLDVIDAIAACFPGGSMTGAPKENAIKTLAALEPGPRGLYSGCFGWIDDSGDAELAMTIRGIELRVDPHTKTTRLFVGAGGGITADSVPENELAERDLKAAGVLAALKLASR